MRRLQSGNKLLIASHNPGKLREFAELLQPYGIETVSAGDLDLPEPEETGDSFEANALLKAFAASQATGLPALADDSGLEVEALDGAPGIYSARWGGPDKDFATAMKRVHDEVTARNGWSEDGRRANFNATLVLAWPNLSEAGSHVTFVGKVFGTLQWPPRGEAGFGYDPMFQPDGADKTFGEMTSAEKHGGSDWSNGGLSHRARALKQFVEASVDGAKS
jgi:XTP/dITP diphosphohydrolase